MRANPILTMLFLLGAGLTPALAAGAPGGVPVGWKDKDHTTEKLPAGLPQPAFDAIARWTGWAGTQGYRMDLDAQGRLLLLTPQKGGTRSRELMRIVGRAETWFDAVLPAVAPAPGTPAADTGERPATPAPPPPLPEDPEAPPPGLGGQSGTKAPEKPATTRAWGSGAVAPDSVTGVLIVLQDEADYGRLLDHLEKTVPYLKDWIEPARQQTGLTLEDPLLGAYAENAAGQEEWNGDHELLNRTVQLLTLRRFGQQPNWLVQGIAWEAEMSFDGSIYCYPFRDGFVFEVEHTGWPSDLRIAFKDRASKHLRMEEFAKWPRGTWDPEAARLAWGFVHHLVGAQRDRGPLLSKLLDGYRAVRDEKDRRATGPFSWERIPNWNMPVEDQERVLTEVYGKDVFQKATLALRSIRDASRSAQNRLK